MDIRITLVVDEPQEMKDMDKDERLELIEGLMEKLSDDTTLNGFIPDEYILCRKVVDQNTIEIGIDLLGLIGRKPDERVEDFMDRFNPDDADTFLKGLTSAISKPGGVDPAQGYIAFPGMKVQRYIPKPKAVSAIRVMDDDASLAAVIEFVGYELLDAEDAREAGGVFVCDKHSRTAFANMGDYIVKHDAGYFSVCSAEEFVANYDLFIEAAK